jgi:hypothetical protein
MRAISLENVAPRRLLARAAALSVVAGLIHLVMGPVYFEEWLGYGAFFFAAAASQILFAMLLAAYPPHRSLLWAGILGNAAIVALWAVTRTLGIPFFGPQAGMVQPVGIVDLAATLVEMALIAHLAVVLRTEDRLDRRPLVE